jgi:hypothetical protein
MKKKLTKKQLKADLRNIANWEKEQKVENVKYGFWIGIAVGLILGAVLTQLGFYIGKLV